MGLLDCKACVLDYSAMLHLSCFWGLAHQDLSHSHRRAPATWSHGEGRELISAAAAAQRLVALENHISSVSRVPPLGEGH